MQDDEDELQRHAVRRARLVAALGSGRRRSWAERRGLLPAVVGGTAAAALIAFGCGVTVVVQDQLAQTRAQQRAQEARQEQQAADDAARRTRATPTPSPAPGPGATPGPGGLPPSAGPNG